MDVMDPAAQLSGDYIKNPTLCTSFVVIDSLRISLSTYLLFSRRILVLFLFLQSFHYLQTRHNVLYEGKSVSNCKPSLYVAFATLELIWGL